MISQHIKEGDPDAGFLVAFAISIDSLDPSESEGALPTVPSATFILLQIALKSFIDNTDTSLIKIC